MNEAAVQRAQAYFERLMKNPHRWIRITCKKGNRQDRRDTYHMIKHMLDLAGIKYRLPAKLDHYTIMYTPDPIRLAVSSSGTFTFNKADRDAAITEVGRQIHQQINDEFLRWTISEYNDRGLNGRSGTDP